MPIVLHENYEGAGSFIAQALRRYGSVAWFRLYQGLRDNVKVGTRLARTLNQALSVGSVQIGTGVAYEYVIEQFKPITLVPGSFFLVIDGAEEFPAFAQDILALNQVGCRVVTIYRGGKDAFEAMQDVTVLESDELRMTREEMLACDKGFVAYEIREAIWQEFRGHPLATKARLSEIQGQQLVVPQPDPFIVTETIAAHPEAVFGKLVAGQKYEDAFFYAAHYLPERLPEVLDQAGESFLKHGGLEPMFRVLNGLSEAYRQTDAFILWLAQSAKRVNRLDDVCNEIISYCETFDHPDALAFTATFSHHLPTSQRREWLEASRVSEKRGFFTYLYGYHLEPSENLDARRAWHEHALRLSYQRNEPALMVDALWELVIDEIEQGRYSQAFPYLMRAWDVWNNNDFSDEYTRLVLFNAEMYLGLMMGKLDARVKEFLDIPLPFLGSKDLRLQELLTTTKIELELWQGNLVSAERVGRDALARFNDSAEKTWRVPELIALSLIEQRKPELANDLLLETASNLLDARPRERLKLLAELTFIESDPERALRATQRYFSQDDQVFHYLPDSLGMALAHLYLVQQKTGHFDEFVIPDSLKNLIRNIDIEGLRLFISPFELFKPVIQQLLTKPKLNDKNRLRLNVFGAQPSATLDDQRLALGRRELEALFILSTVRRSLTYAELYTMLYSEHEASPATVRKLIYRLRQQVPISSQLQLEVSVGSDYQELTVWLDDPHNFTPPLQYPVLLRESLSPWIAEQRFGLELRLHNLLRQPEWFDLAVQFCAEISDPEVLLDIVQGLPEHDLRAACFREQLGVLQHSLSF